MKTILKTNKIYNIVTVFLKAQKNTSVKYLAITILGKEDQLMAFIFHSTVQAGEAVNIQNYK